MRESIIDGMKMTGSDHTRGTSMKNDDDSKEFKWYVALQILKIAALLGGILIISHVIELLRGG